MPSSGRAERLSWISFQSLLHGVASQVCALVQGTSGMHPLYLRSSGQCQTLKYLFTCTTWDFTDWCVISWPNRFSQCTRHPYTNRDGLSCCSLSLNLSTFLLARNTPTYHRSFPLCECSSVLLVPNICHQSWILLWFLWHRGNIPFCNWWGNLPLRVRCKDCSTYPEIMCTLFVDCNLCGVLKSLIAVIKMLSSDCYRARWFIHWPKVIYHLNEAWLFNSAILNVASIDICCNSLIEPQFLFRWGTGHMLFQIKLHSLGCWLDTIIVSITDE